MTTRFGPTSRLGAVKSQTARGLDQLRAALGSRGVTVDPAPEPSPSLSDLAEV